MNEDQLLDLVKDISESYFGRPFLGRVRINRRMTTTGGRYHLDDHHIEINAHFLLPARRKALVGIIKHELCHYHLHVTGRGFRHSDHDFQLLLDQVGGSRYAPDIGLRRKQKRHYLYQCQNCGQFYRRVRRVNTKRYFCGRCHGQLRLVKIFA